MNSTKIFIVLTILFIFTPCISSGDNENNLSKILADGIDIVESYKDIGMKEQKPSRLFITIPGDTTLNSYLIDIALGIDIRGFFGNKIFFMNNQNTTINILPFADYHKNTLISKKQNHLKYGISLMAKKGLFKRTLWLYLNSFGFPINRDFVNNQWGSQISTYFSPVFDNTKHTLPYYILPQEQNSKINDTVKRLTLLEYFYLPKIGYEYTSITKAPYSNNLGKIHSLFLGIDFFLKIYEGTLNSYCSFEYREYFKNTTSTNQKIYRLFRSGINLNLSKLIKIEYFDFLIGYDYFNGEDPWNGLEKQKYSQFSFKIKL